MEDKSVDELTEYWLMFSNEVDLCNAFGYLMLTAKKENQKKIIDSFFMRKADHFNSVDEIPEVILKAMAKVKDEEIAKNFNKDLMGIVNVWDNIRKEIACRKAYSVLRDGLEIRPNANQILSSFYAVSREKPKNISEFDLFTTEGSEIIGHDMKFGGVPGKAIKRSNILAKMIDTKYAKTCTKKFPDFSFVDEKTGITVKVLHPRDKENLLWGYKTKCCFIPGGVADNYGNKGKSFVEYCATTGYAGIVEIGRENANGIGSFDIYEAFPVLVNGNTASAAEIFTGAIRDFDYGTIIGTQTFGKGIVQSTIPLTDGSAVKLTTQTYYTPSGECIHGTGITPDEVLEYEFLGGEEDAYSVDLDNQIQKALEVLASN